MRTIVLAAGLIIIPQLLPARLPDMIPYRKGDLWGYCDSTKKIVIEPQWAQVGFFKGNTARVLTGDRGWGLIDQSGKYVQEPDYEWIEEEPVHGLRMGMIGDSDKFGMFDLNGNIVIPFKYIWFHWEGTLVEAADKKCNTGVFDSTGRVVIPFVYNIRGDFPTSMGDSGMFAMCRKGKWGVVDTTGNVIIPFRYYWISAYGDYWEVRTDYFEGQYYTSRGRLIGDSVNVEYQSGPAKETLVNGCRIISDDRGLYGFADARYNIIISPKYLACEDFNESGLANVYIRPGECRLCFVRGYIDKKGTEYWED